MGIGLVPAFESLRQGIVFKLVFAATCYATVCNLQLHLPWVHPLQAMSGPAESDASVFNQRRKPPITPNRQMINNPGNIWVGGAGV